MKRWMACMLACLLLMSMAGCNREAGAEPSANGHKALAPDFTVYDVDGNPVKLSDFRGKPVVLNFWASWCLPCKAEMPEFQDAFERQGDRIHFLIVNITDGQQETVAKAHAYVTKEGFTFPVYYDTTTTAARTYAISSIPVTYFIDADGYLVTQTTGRISAETLQNNIAILLAQK